MLNRFLNVRRFALVVLLTAGCSEKGPEIGQVTGTITARGKPLPRAALAFNLETVHDVAFIVLGVTDDQGKYELSYGSKIGKGMGAPVGSYRVVVSDVTPAPRRRYGTEYSNITSTPLRAEVKPGPQTIDLEVK